MGRSKVLAAVLVAVLLVAIALTFGVANASAKGCDRHQSHQALFVQTDEPSANHIVVYDRAGNGMLKFAGSYATGGKGGVAAGAAVDPLASQGSLATAQHGSVLLAVNAGSDTLSLFRIARGDKLLLKQVVPSGGQFPVSIAVRGHLVYALNAGGAGSVQGYWLFGNHLWAIAGSNRSLGLANTNPPNFLASPGMVGFSPDGRRLIVTTKASGSMIDVFDVGPGGLLSSAPVMNASATPVPFAFSFDRNGRARRGRSGSEHRQHLRDQPRRHADDHRLGRRRPARCLLDQHGPRPLLRLQRRRSQHQHLRAGRNRYAQRDRRADAGRGGRHRLAGDARRSLPLPGVRRSR